MDAESNPAGPDLVANHHPEGTTGSPVPADNPGHRPGLEPDSRTSVALTAEGWACVAALNYHAKRPELRSCDLIDLQATLIPLFTQAMKLARTNLANNDQGIALGFLHKAFGPSAVTDAREWIGDTWDGQALDLVQPASEESDA